MIRHQFFSRVSAIVNTVYRRPLDLASKKIIINGIRELINGWFASYLFGRLQVIEVGFNLSTECMTSCDMPQRFVLGPLLLLIYINYIHNSSAKFSFFLFADDTNLLYAKMYCLLLCVLPDVFTEFK